MLKKQNSYALILSNIFFILSAFLFISYIARYGWLSSIKASDIISLAYNPFQAIFLILLIIYSGLSATLYSKQRNLFWLGCFAVLACSFFEIAHQNSWISSANYLKKYPVGNYLTENANIYTTTIPTLKNRAKLRMLGPHGPLGPKSYTLLNYDGNGSYFYTGDSNKLKFTPLHNQKIETAKMNQYQWYLLPHLSFFDWLCWLLSLLLMLDPLSRALRKRARK